MLAFKQFSTKLVVKAEGVSFCFPSDPAPPQPLVWSPDPTSKFYQADVAPVISTLIDTYPLAEDLSKIENDRPTSPSTKKSG